MNSPRLRPRFAPVPVKVRHDGWTAERQVRFIDRLAVTRSVVRACNAVGMSTASAYKLRRHPQASAFAEAWAIACDASPRRMRVHRGPPKVGEMEKVKGPPVSPGRSSQGSQSLQTLERLLARLRGTDLRSHP
jgi:hypothetical protein